MTHLPVDTDENLQANRARAAKVVKREDVMRDDLTFHVLRITSIAASVHVGCTFIFQTK